MSLNRQFHVTVTIISIVLAVAAGLLYIWGESTYGFVWTAINYYGWEPWTANFWYGWASWLLFQWLVYGWSKDWLLTLEQ